MTQECACVPETGMPNSLPASTLEVEAHRPPRPRRLAQHAAGEALSRRRPNSATRAPAAARHTRAAFVAMSVSKLTQLSSAVSRSWQCMMGPHTRTRGSWGNTTVPSATASTSHASSKSYAR